MWFKLFHKPNGRENNARSAMNTKSKLEWTAGLSWEQNKWKNVPGQLRKGTKLDNDELLILQLTLTSFYWSALSAGDKERPFNPEDLLVLQLYCSALENKPGAGCIQAHPSGN